MSYDHWKTTDPADMELGSQSQAFYIVAEPEFPAPNAHNSFVYFWVDRETGERHGPFQFRSGALRDANKNQP
jgi:hypothetical protein